MTNQTEDTLVADVPTVDDFVAQLTPKARMQITLDIVNEVVATMDGEDSPFMLNAFTQLLANPKDYIYDILVDDADPNNDSDTGYNTNIVWHGYHTAIINKFVSKDNCKFFKAELLDEALRNGLITHDVLTRVDSVRVVEHTPISDEYGYKLIIPKGPGDKPTVLYRLRNLNHEEQCENDE